MPVFRKNPSGDIIREAVSKVRRALPGQQNERQFDPKHPSGVPAASVSGAAPQSFVEAVRDAAAAAVAAAAIDVERGVAGAGKIRIAEKVREAVAHGEDILWEEALGDTKEKRSEEVDETTLVGMVQGKVEIDDLCSEALASSCSSLEATPDDVRSARVGSVAPVKVERSRGIGSRRKSWSKGSWRAPGRLERRGSGGVMLSKSGLETETTERSTSGEVGLGEMCGLDEGEREKELPTEKAVVSARSLEEGEQRQQMSEVSGNVGRMGDSSGGTRVENKETISSEYATVEGGVLKPVGGDGDDFVVPAEAEGGGDTLKMNPSPCVGESAPEALAADPAFGACGEQAVSSLEGRSGEGESARGAECGGEDKGLGVDRRGFELGGGEAWERQDGEGQQGGEEEREWVVKMQELHPRYPYC